MPVRVLPLHLLACTCLSTTNATTSPPTMRCQTTTAKPSQLDTLMQAAPAERVAAGTTTRNPSCTHPRSVSVPPASTSPVLQCLRCYCCIAFGCCWSGCCCSAACCCCSCLAEPGLLAGSALGCTSPTMRRTTSVQVTTPTGRSWSSITYTLRPQKRYSRTIQDEQGRQAQWHSMHCWVGVHMASAERQTPHIHNAGMLP